MEFPTTPRTNTISPSIRNMDLFYMYVAGHITAIPVLRDYLNELYETNKIAFYDKAKASPYYDATYITDSPLEKEVSMKRVFGILLYSEQDEQLQSQICKAIIKYNKSFAFFAKSYSLEQLAIFFKKDAAAKCSDKSFDELNAPLYLVGYIVYCNHGLAKKDKPSVKLLHDAIASDITKRESYDRNGFLRFVENFNISKHFADNKTLREFFATAKSSNILCGLLDSMDALQNNKSHVTATASKLIKTFGSCPDEETDSSAYTSLLATRIFSLYGKSITLASQDIRFSNEELEQLHKITAMCTLVKKSDTSGIVHVDDFVQALWIAMLVKTLRQERDFYFKNNSETQFFELRNLEREVAQLQAQLSDHEQLSQEAHAHAAALNEQIALLNAELAKDTKDAAKPLLGEISHLNSRIAVLESKLQEEAEKNAELARLREFVFNMQQGSDIQIEEVSLEKLIDGKRIYIFGGHINWRNKLKQKYPKLEVLDGHNVSFDEQKLLGADMVLMNTSNMSHALYYKIIEVLRKNNIPFDYLGKYHNPELLEKEIAETLLRQKN